MRSSDSVKPMGFVGRLFPVCTLIWNEKSEVDNSSALSSTVLSSVKYELPDSEDFSAMPG